MDLIGIGALGAGTALLLAIAPLARRQRRQKMGLEPLSYRETWTWPRRWQ